MSAITVGPVYRDPKGKMGRDGKQEHCFIVRSGSFITNVREANAELADAARFAFLSANPTAEEA